MKIINKINKINKVNKINKFKINYKIYNNKYNNNLKIYFLN